LDHPVDIIYPVSPQLAIRPSQLEVLLCDEPTSGLDSAAASNMVARCLSELPKSPLGGAVGVVNG